MTVTRGLEHVFLGMKLRFDRENRDVEVDMIEYLQECIQDSGLDISTKIATPVYSDIFNSNNSARTLFLTLLGYFLLCMTFFNFVH